MSMKLIAHRCGTDKYPELTLNAASFSLKNGADYVEMDIRFTKDKVPVISHDDNASVLFGSKMEIAELMLDEFLSLRYKADPHYSSITLAQVLQSTIAPILFHVKVGDEQLHQILNCIHSYGYEDNVIMGIQTPEDVKTVKDYNSNIKILAFSPRKELLPLQSEQGADIIRLWEPWITMEDVDYYHNAGKQIWVMSGSPNDGTVGYTDFDNLKAWEKLGVDGVLINEVVMARKALSGVAK